MLEALQSGGTHTVGDLAELLGVDERTVRRYVDHLLDLDVPVETVRGRYGGYRLAPGFRMPPLMLTDDEALSTVLGLVAGRRTGLVSGSATAADSAIAKLRRVLPSALARKLEALLEMTSFTTQATTTASVETRVLLTFAEAARERHPVAIHYTGRDGRHSERIVLPYGIVAHSGRWYISGADSSSGQVRTFRLDRVGHPRVMPGSFELPDGFNPADHVLSALAGTPWAHEVSLRIRGTLEQIRSRLPEGIATIEAHALPPAKGIDRPASGDAPPLGVDPTTSIHAGGDWFRVRLRVEQLNWLPGVLAALDCPFVIDNPLELRELVLSLAERLSAAAAFEQDVDNGSGPPS
jgi:predicted DNA-binding transcriptional regulator YafY